MNASVLMVGAPAFCDRLIQRIRALSDLVVLQASNFEAALAALAEQPPALVVIQASNVALWRLCTHIRQQRHLRWLYCLLFDDQTLPPSDADQTWLLHHTQRTIQALDQGADAYLWLPDGGIPPAVGHQGKPLAKDRRVGWNRAFNAHLKKAQERWQTYQELSKTNDLLSAIALVDSLTEIGNRRALDWELPRQIEAVRQQTQPLSLIILDIDYFKVINDTHGHLVGDEVLKMFAERLCHHLRCHETPFRYGGEEFVVLLPATDLAQSNQVAERLRHVMARDPFATNRGVEVSLTISLGVATLRDGDDEKGQKLLNRADQRLLRAKRNGRDQVVVH